MSHSVRDKYWDQVSHAKQRGIAFELTFEQWLVIWFQSGKFEQRGCRSHQYVMARFEDRGPYAVGNVKIITMKENMIEGQTGRRHSEETKRLMSVSARKRQRV